MSEELKFKPTEKDEEEFFLMYHLQWAPSEVKQLSDDYRKWLIARFIHQRTMEHEAMEQMRLRSQLSDLRV